MLAGGVVFALLHYGVGAIFLSGASGRPRALLSGEMGLGFGLVTAVALVLGAYLVAVLIGSTEPTRLLVIVNAALALWLFEDGSRGATMDDWLIRMHQRPGPADGRPYWLLIPDYIILLAIALAIRQMLKAAFSAAPAPPPAPPGAARSARSEGLTALMISVAIALLIIMVLMGARHGATYRGQVYFAVYVAFLFSTGLAAQITGVRTLKYYWPAPFIVGLIGLALAALRPGFSPPFDVVNTIPAWAPARALPLEMISVGLLAVGWAVGSRRPAPADGEGGK